MTSAHHDFTVEAPDAAGALVAFLRMNTPPEASFSCTKLDPEQLYRALEILLRSRLNIRPDEEIDFVFTDGNGQTRWTEPAPLCRAAEWTAGYKDYETDKVLKFKPPVSGARSSRGYVIHVTSRLVTFGGSRIIWQHPENNAETATPAEVTKLSMQ